MRCAATQMLFATLGLMSPTTVALAADKPAPQPMPGVDHRDREDDRGASPEQSDDIIVTAQRRSERLQDVPLSIAVLTDEGIQRQGINSLEDVTSRIAGLHTSRDGTQSSFSIRGIQASAGSDPTSATAGLYLDDYPLYDTWFRFSTPDVRIFDVQRIEVLRGPQGTLYGATSLAGSIRIIANKPDLDAYSASLVGTVADTIDGAGSYDVSGVVNVPLSAGKVALRAVGYTRKDGGYIDNPVQGRANTNTQRTEGGRLYLRAQPNDTLNLLANVTYQRDTQSDQSASFYDDAADGSAREWRSSLPSRVRSSLLLTSLNGAQQIAGGILSLTGIYAHNKLRGEFDATPAVSLFGGGMVPTVEDRPSESTIQILEARYTSDATKPLRFVLGAYYNSRFRSFEQTASAPSLVAVSGTSFVYKAYAEQHATEYAAFGEGTYSISPKLAATLGLRVFRNDYRFYGVTNGLIISLADPFSVQTTDASNNQSSYVPRVSLAYRLSENANVYLTASKGYRFGLTNYNSDSRGSIPLPYKSDTLWNYEAGAKLRLLNGQMLLNTSAYYIAWSDLQLPFRNASNLIYTTNAGDAQSYGLETEWSFRPVGALELNAAVSIGKAEITHGNPNVIRRAASARGPAIIGLLKGDRLPGSQMINASGGIQYTRRDIGQGDAYVRIDDIFVGSSYSDFMKDGALRAGNYNLVNLRAGYLTRRFEITAFANNLLGSQGVVSALPNADLLGTDAAFRVRPRTIGITFRTDLTRF